VSATPWQPSLEDAHTKLNWARKHFEILRAEIEPFEQKDAHTITVDINAETGEYSFHIHGLDAPSADWGLQIGDCLQNARTALDYVAVRLLALGTGQHPRDVQTVQFPVYDNPDKFGSRKPGPTVTEFRKHPKLSGYLTRIEELQPFNVGNASIWGAKDSLPFESPLPGALQQLANLNSADKHRVVHASWLGSARGPFTGPKPPPEFKHITGSYPGGPLKDGTEIAHWWFETPLPFEWQPTEMEMKGQFPIHVAFDESYPISGVLEVVPFCLWGVAEVLALFEPVFSHGAPPLPVTAVGEPPPLTSWVAAAHEGLGPQASEA
jgi:hypothetical protein